MKDSKIVFIEYSTARRGQHFMTVVNVSKGKRQIIGRIFRKYDAEKKKMFYTAKDWMGNDVFVDTHDLYALKQNFIECGKTMAMTIPAGPNQKNHDDYPYSEKTGTKQSKEKPAREKELANIRNKNSEKGKESEKDQETQNENKEPENDNSKPEKSDRENELEQIRDQNNEQEKDEEMEQEIDM